MAFKVTKDGEVRASGLTENEAFVWLLRHQGQSVHHAVTHEGWDIVPEATHRVEGEMRVRIVGNTRNPNHDQIIKLTERGTPIVFSAANMLTSPPTPKPEAKTVHYGDTFSFVGADGVFRLERKPLSDGHLVPVHREEQTA